MDINNIIADMADAERLAELADKPEEALRAVRAANAETAAGEEDMLRTVINLMSEVKNDAGDNTGSFTQTPEAIIRDRNARRRVAYANGMIERIYNSTDYLQNAISELRTMELAPGASDTAIEAKASAIAEIVREREETNRKVLDYYMGIANEQEQKASKKFSDAELDFIRFMLDKLVTTGSITKDQLSELSKGLFKSIIEPNK